jgi:lipopolysaccharide export system protein LptA
MMEDANLKRLAVDIEDTQKQQLNAGDNNSVANLAQTGMNLGNQLSSGDSGKYFANQIEGVLIGNVVLQQLDPNTSYDFLNGETSSQALQEREQQRKSLSQLAKSVDAVFPEMTEEEENSYFDRSKIYGEVDAMRWMLQQHPPNSSQNGQQ